MTILDNLDNERKKLAARKAAKEIEQKEKENQFKKGASLASEALKGMGSPFNIIKYLFSFGVNRDEPMDTQALFEFFGRDTLNQELMIPWNKAMDDLKALQMEDVSIKSIDGLKLNGHLYKAKKQKRLIIAVHGWRSHWYKDFAFVAPFLMSQGCSILFIEQRAQDSSEGDYMTFGVFEKFDVADWIDFAISKFGKRVPIYLYGVSMGSASVMMVSGNRLPQSVKGIIADCGYTSPEAIWKHVANDILHLVYPEHMMENLCKETLHFDPDKHSCANALSKATVPLFFVHGQNDNFVPMEMSLENYDACTSEKMILIVPGADHGLSYRVDNIRYEEKLLSFWSKYDKTPFKLFKKKTDEKEEIKE